MNSKAEYHLIPNANNGVFGCHHANKSKQTLNPDGQNSIGVTTDVGEEALKPQHSDLKANGNSYVKKNGWAPCSYSNGDVTLKPEGDSCTEPLRSVDTEKGKKISDPLDKNLKSGGMARQQWAGEADFILACIGNAVGLGNLWRFPYLCYDSGGGAFLIPYFIMLVFTGVPLLYLEVGIGQYTQQGPVGAIKKLCPFFQGAGLATVVLSFLLTSYYNVILTWAMYFLVTSCFNPLPWSNCDNDWNTDKCWDDSSANGTVLRPNNSRSPTQEYFEQEVLQQSSGIEEQGKVVWELALLMLLAWILVFFCLFKGVKWTGKVVYFTAVFPYIIIIALLIRGLTLPGSMKGVDFFINPKWHLLKEPKVWVNAAAQNFNSIGIAFGSMIAFSSYSKPDSKIFRNSMIICAVNSATSILAGFAIFSVLGHVATLQGQDVEDVVSQGPGLVFQVYPAAFSSMSYPGAQIFAFFFFFMLICLAIDSQFASVEVVLTTFEDHFGKQIKRVLKHKWVLVLFYCVFTYFLSFPNITQGGIYFFKIIDSYSSGISLMVIAFFEVISVTWFYGAKRLAKDICVMTGRRVSMYWLVCWYGISPALILAIMVFNWVEYTPVQYDDYIYPDWGQGLGWGLACLSLVCIPLGIIKALVETPGDSFGQKFLNSFKPLDDITPVTKSTEVEPDTVCHMGPEMDVPPIHKEIPDDDILAISSVQLIDNGTHVTKM